MSSLLELAARVETMDYITCPLCGETDFDIPGFVFSHDRWCEVRSACIDSLADRNEEVAAALRARASQ